MNSYAQCLPKQASIDLSPAPAKVGGIVTNNFTTLLKAAKPVRIRMLVTPDQARAWLETTNINNRPLRESDWMKIWLDILENRWKYNGEPISFGSNGALLNGQHRLKACAESDLPIDADVIFGLDPAARDTIDIGRVRTAGDIAHLDGVENSTATCAAAYLLLVHEKGGIQQLGNQRVTPSKTKVNERVRNDPRISEVAGRSSNLGRGLASPRVVAFCYYLFSEQRPDLADRFFSQLASGANLDKNSPVYRLRERLRTNAAGKAKLPVREIVALFFKAWIAYRNNEPVKCLRWHNSGDNPEKFPEI